MLTAANRVLQCWWRHNMWRGYLLWNAHLHKFSPTSHEIGCFNYSVQLLSTIISISNASLAMLRFALAPTLNVVHSSQYRCLNWGTPAVAASMRVRDAQPTHGFYLISSLRLPSEHRSCPRQFITAPSPCLRSHIVSTRKHHTFNMWPAYYTWNFKCSSNCYGWASCNIWCR